MKERTCVYRYLGVCPHCSEDYDPNHHPNNLDCPMFRLVSIGKFVVIEKEPKTWVPPENGKNMGA